MTMAGAVLVTGGTGYIGGWCVTELLRRGHTVRATVRNPSRAAELRAVAPVAVAGGRLSVVVADLASDDGWDAAVEGCEHVLHVASPLGREGMADPAALIVPARDGALRVLAAAARAGVRRVVMTSSCAAATPPLGSGGDGWGEEVWTDLEHRLPDPYRASKVVAEHSAWKFAAGLDGTTLTTVLPGTVFGPVTDVSDAGAVALVGRLLRGMPGVPRFGLNVVDVRDVVDLHIRAMTDERAAGERFIAVSGFLWLADIARELREKLGPAAERVPTRGLPDLLVRAAAAFDPVLRRHLPLLGRAHAHTSLKARRLLGWQPRPAGTTVVDCAESLLAHDAVRAA
ncbi:NAD-dependent epimerase/dehydratase family protein [Saccharothrix obliqua]|uniref:NAD-dependent epimerase/dehydratase family protein n=1 Tax=Saccharothrix obliqua TaxID=2861747 RepID=UPI001C6010C5|nr:NAD-dependent epimerase/dehydratase family protein [Saccharothrix obliqua]MBW4716799.1 NAD-dependent epimerase/dehydratase family protein [Saccharothrix obliqua]